MPVAKCSLLPQSAHYSKPENSPCRSACLAGRHLFSRNSYTRAKTCSSIMAGWVLEKNTLILLSVMQPLFQLVRLGVGLEIHRAASVFRTLQYPRHRFRTPLIGLLWQRLSVPLGVMSLDGQNLFGSQQLCNLHEAFSCNTQVENPFHDFGGFLVHDPFLFVCRCFLIPVGRIIYSLD